MKQLLLQARSQLKQAAVIIDGRLMECFTEPPEAKQAKGNVYKGRVVNVLPGMQAAFVDIGQGKNAYLYIDDLLHANLHKQPKDKPPIERLVKVGDERIVQVIKEAIAGKGARVTTQISLPGRNLVYMPVADYVGVSRKIPDTEERERLRRLGEALMQQEEGVIMRTAAAGLPDEWIAGEIADLRAQWQALLHAASQEEAPCRLHADIGLAHRLVRDSLRPDVDELWIDDPAAIEETAALITRLAPALADRLRCFEVSPGASGQALFEHFLVPQMLEEAYGRKIRLPSGGNLVWERTEALTVVDINTGKYTGSGSDLTETIVQTNLEAALEIARLLRLRDVGGIVLVDFIDMKVESQRAQVRDQLSEALGEDRGNCHIVGWTKLGLLELTRKKTRDNSLEHIIAACAACQGSGIEKKQLELQSQ